MSNVDLDLKKYLRQAVSRFREGDLNCAREDSESLLNAYPDNSHALHFSGIMDYCSNDFEVAALKFFKAIQNDPQNAYFFYNFGLSLKAQKKFEEALNFFQNALALKSSHSGANENSDRQSSKQRSIAVEAYRHAIESNQDPSYLAFHFYKEGLFGDAEYVYKKILEASPENDRALNDFGNVLLEMRRVEEASTCFRKAIEANPNLDQASYNLANVTSDLGQADEAMKLYRKSIEINPDFFEAYFNLGLELEKLKDFDNAVDCYMRVNQINPNYAKAHYQLARIFQRLGKFDLAISEYQKTVELDPYYGEAQYYFADFIRSQGDIEKAVELSSRAFSMGEETQMLEGGVLLESSYTDSPSLDKEKSNLIAIKDEFLFSALKGETPEIAPSDYVRFFFDEFSKRFERHLVDNLEYKVPGLMRDVFDSVISTGCKFKNAVDLGCGTGLSGNAFISIVDRITGVDLSPKMIEQSKEKNIYDTLYEGGILEFLSESTDRFDLFIAADVLVYLGDPFPLFEKIKNISSKEAIFVLSIESCDESGYQIRQTGRYSHNCMFVEDMANRFGFELLTKKQAGLRKENEKWVDGEIFVFKYQN
jgi:predicted TPR repeat methyltransferase